VHSQWLENGNVAWKIAALEHVLASGRFTGKRSTPWGPGTVHDYMHAKITVADDIVFAGSYNLSHSGEQNAENMLEIEDAEIADRLAGFIDDVRARYPTASLPVARAAP
jgi:phosphatidylserine/phosphatidylglycerophosphate/cardiolipin synthase-like enzyme